MPISQFCCFFFFLCGALLQTDFILVFNSVSMQQPLIVLDFQNLAPPMRNLHPSLRWLAKTLSCHLRCRPPVLADSQNLARLLLCCLEWESQGLAWSQHLMVTSLFLRLLVQGLLLLCHLKLVPCNFEWRYLWQRFSSPSGPPALFYSDVVHLLRWFHRQRTPRRGASEDLYLDPAFFLFSQCHHLL